MTVVTFTDFRPAPRFDGVSWRHALIAESANPDGPWVQIDDIALAADADPAHPQIRNFTTDNATLLSGWYLVTFTDNTGAAEQPMSPLQNNPASQQSYLPGITEVALKILSRTTDQYGNEVGTFNASTRPTDTQVSQMIAELGPTVADMIGDDIPVALWDDAANVVALRVAMEIELSFFSDQVNTGRSIYPQLKELYESELTRVSRAVELAEEGDGSVVESGPSGKVSYSFPDSTKSIGLSTRW